MKGKRKKYKDILKNLRYTKEDRKQGCAILWLAPNNMILYFEKKVYDTNDNQTNDKSKKN